jgi:S-adenosylmethionine-diacylgycerolhomoserine-N-methlytransferase
MGFLSDLKILYHMTMKPIRGADHAARLESFYAGQADAYDDFRKRLLKGREELWNTIPFPDQGRWIDMGGGTGANIDFFGERVEQLSEVQIVDLSPSLLRIAKQRIEERKWSNVFVVEADATTYQPEGDGVDVVTFSYSLTMIPDWFAAIDNALAMLKPGGVIGVVDFYVSRKHPPDGLKRHRWFTRSFWPIWFAYDNVFPNRDHGPFLHRKFEPLSFEECRAKVPYMPFLRTPYYQFIGRKSVSP